MALTSPPGPDRRALALSSGAAPARLSRCTVGFHLHGGTLSKSLCALLIPLCTVENRLHYCHYCLFLPPSPLASQPRHGRTWRVTNREGWELGPVLFCLRERLADARGALELSVHISEGKKKKQNQTPPPRLPGSSSRSDSVEVPSLFN